MVRPFKHKGGSVLELERSRKQQRLTSTDFVWEDGFEPPRLSKGIYSPPHSTTLPLPQVRILRKKGAPYWNSKDSRV